MVLVMSLTMTNLRIDYSDEVDPCENLAAQSAMVMMEKRMVTMKKKKKKHEILHDQQDIM